MASVVTKCWVKHAKFSNINPTLVTVTFCHFFVGFLAGLRCSQSNTAVQVKRFTLVKLRESSAVGAAALGAKTADHPLPIDYDSMVDEFFCHVFQ